MTSPYVSFPRPPATARPSAWPVLRVILSIGLVLGGGVGYLIAGFIAVVTWTGCFISCEGENQLAGAAIGLVALALLAAGPALVGLLYRNRGWLWVAGFATAVGAVFMVLVVASN